MGPDTVRATTGTLQQLANGTWELCLCGYDHVLLARYTAWDLEILLEAASEYLHPSIRLKTIR
jgi:hypothetical protein